MLLEIATPRAIVTGMTDPKPIRRWFQFSLRTLLIFVTLCAIPCSWLAVKIRQARRERETAEAIKELVGAGGGVEWSKPSVPAWLRSLVGEDVFVHIHKVFLSGPQVTDVQLDYLNGLSQLEDLSIWGTQITDTGLEHLHRLSQLRHLEIVYFHSQDSKITNAGLGRLGGLNQLQELRLINSQATDAGLENLKGLSQLTDLNISGIQITDGQLPHLSGLTQVRELTLFATPLTDAGLEHLTGLKQLRRLYLNGSQVTDEGVRKLQQTLPNCKIFH